MNHGCEKCEGFDCWHIRQDVRDFSEGQPTFWVTYVGLYAVSSGFSPEPTYLTGFKCRTTILYVGQDSIGNVWDAGDADIAVVYTLLHSSEGLADAHSCTVMGLRENMLTLTQ